MDCCCWGGIVKSVSRDDSFFFFFCFAFCISKPTFPPTAPLTPRFGGTWKPKPSGCWAEGGIVMSAAI